MSDPIKAALDAATLTIEGGCKQLCEQQEGGYCSCRESAGRTIAAFLRALPRGTHVPATPLGGTYAIHLAAMSALAAAVEKAARDD
jgi:hypothetical protein